MLLRQKMSLTLQYLVYTIVVVETLICVLLSYSLFIGAGDVLIDGCKKIGFYNYCLHNTTNGGGCHCITQLEDLHSKTFPHGATLSLILTYSSLVTVLMGLITMILAQGLKDDVLWKFELGLNVISLVGLFGGTSIHLFLNWDQYELFQMTPGFWALLLAIGGLFLQTCLLSRYVRLNHVLLTCKTEGEAAEELNILMA
ncbi:transmembrane protein 140 [Anomaloglossus baeobatrachus]|uniref:transmembrane protein 140 n=1 Tax=Anomaloglossus baeobatrachus TaxID=238106 RepID=UPI003F50BD32